jgi:hypothetical protein
MYSSTPTPDKSLLVTSCYTVDSHEESSEDVLVPFKGEN